MSAPTGPILVAGLAGSGKTPLRRVLGAHPEIVMTRRTYLWTRFHGRFGDLTDPDALDRAIEVLCADPHAQQLGPEPARLREELLSGDAPPTGTRLVGLLHEHHARRLGARRWGDQLGGVEHVADDVLAAWPDAHVLHMLRRPSAHDAVGLIRWQSSRQLARRNRRRHPGQYHVLSLERLVRMPRHVLAEVCAVLGEDVHPSMLAALDDVHARLVGAGHEDRAVGATGPGGGS